MRGPKAVGINDLDTSNIGASWQPFCQQPMDSAKRGTSLIQETSSQSSVSQSRGLETLWGQRT